ncbi:unnamed protein product [Orchesella dallaii]|uniref:Uncharacterized protein n=1 Tax=Orchesella dallaii TaxID=48710 RepID=A0ABP1RNZ5_9HEXA
MSKHENVELPVADYLIANSGHATSSAGEAVSLSQGCVSACDGEEGLKSLVVDDDRNILLHYRLVNSQWKKILDSLIEKSFASGYISQFLELGFENLNGGAVYQNQFRLYPNLAAIPDKTNPFPFKGLQIDPYDNPSYDTDSSNSNVIIPGTTIPRYCEAVDGANLKNKVKTESSTVHLNLWLG